MTETVTNTPRPGETAEQSAARYRSGVSMAKKERDPILVERQKTHGSFESNARISQKIKVVFGTDNCYAGLVDVHKEALDMIAFKLSRILSGQADFKDHWDDIAGYAKLASEVCSK